MNGVRVVLLLACLALTQACRGTGVMRTTPVDLEACVGSWSVDWYDGGLDHGIGTVRIQPDGSLDGMLRDDAFRSAEWNQAVGAVLTGRVSRTGMFEGSIVWNSGRAGWTLMGQLGRDSNGVLCLQANPPGGADDVERTLVVMLHR
jgi:hypothetical protein